MANPTIQLDNSTVSLIALVQLGIDVPASGSIIVTVNPDSARVDEIINDPELNVFIDAGDITLTVDAAVLTPAQSKAYVGYSRVQANHTATTAPGVNDDADAGYSAGSSWTDTSTDTAYICVAETNNGAVWVSIGGAAAFGSPVAVGAANADGSSGLHIQSDHVHAHGDQLGGSLHDLVTITVDGFMSAADKIKLDSLEGTKGGSEFSSINISTTSATFQDAFVGQNIVVPETGAYMIMFEGNIEATNGNTVNEVGIGTDTGGGTIIIVDSQRVMQGNGGAAISTFCHTFVSLTIGDTVTGMFRRFSGSGTTSMDNRRITLIQLSITP
jgi:hypothetical protein